MDFIKTCVMQYIQDGCPIQDQLRGGERVEIPSAFAYTIASFNFSEFYVQLPALIDTILSLQQPSGAWLEYTYSETEEKIGYEGVVPTCFALIALSSLAHHAKNDRVRGAICKGAEYLHRSEKNGYFFKASFNKSDVVNTNLLASFALLQSTSFFPENSFIPEKIKFAAHRTLARAIQSQLLSGAFPYVSFGQKVSYLYHAMATALLGAHSRFVGQPLLSYAFYRGVLFLNRIVDKNGALRWNRANLKDKEGAVWAYGWAHAAYAFSENEHMRVSIEAHMHALQGEKFFKSGDFDGREDLFYTAWILLALSLSREHYVVKKNTTLGLGYWFWYPRSWYRRARMSVRACIRKIHTSSLDLGPVEEYDTH